MSLYNMLFGVNPMAGILMQAIDLERGQVPRFRDCYLDETDSESRIAVHTRTGGGNRPFYENLEECRSNYPEYFGGDDDPSGPWNDDLRASPYYLTDEDDDFDATYATFYFRVPDAFKSLIATMREISGGTDAPGERWQKLLATLNEGGDSPEAKRAIEVGKSIFSAINAGSERPATKNGA